MGFDLSPLIVFTMEKEFTFRGKFSPDYKSLELIGAESYSRLFYNLAGEELDIKVSKHRSRRSDAQNRYYWVIVRFLIEQFYELKGEDYTKDQIHDYNIRVIQGCVPVESTVLGKSVWTMTYKRTSEMNTKEFSDFVEAMIKHYAEEYFITIPPPTTYNFYGDFVKDE